MANPTFNTLRGGCEKGKEQRHGVEYFEVRGTHPQIRATRYIYN